MNGLKFFERAGEIAVLENSEIVKVLINKEKRQIKARIKFLSVVSVSDIHSAEEQIRNAYSVSAVEIEPEYDEGLFSAEIFPVIAEYIAEEKTVAHGILSGANARLNGSELCVTLLNNGRDILITEKCDVIGQEIIKNQFGIDLKIKFISATSVVEEYEKSKEEIAERAEKSQAEVKTSPIIYGREIKGDAFTPLKEISEESGRVTVKGEMFMSPEVKVTRDGRYIVNFSITDYEGSITCKIFGIDKKKYTQIEERLKKGVCLKVKGMAQYDKYARDILITADDVNEAEAEFVTDDAPVKRVELHLHTKMSAMDGMTDVKDLVKRAIKWGHKAIAITDHGVVQAFPDAVLPIPKGSDFKVIFGVEAYLVDIGKPIVFGSKSVSPTEKIVVFDTETTGFSPKENKIIEIGAVKIENGVITDRFSTFVDPEIPIPAKITELTGINDSMITGSETIEKIMPKFVEFCSDAVLVAHNAKFDMGFISANCENLGIEFSPTYIDTVELSRCAVSGLENYKLNTVAAALGVSLEGHHRAVNDAEATAGIYLKLVEKINAENIQDMNIMFSDGESYKDKRYNHAVILAKNYTGLKNLYRIISESNLNYFYKKPRVPKSLYYKHSEGLMIGSACEQGELYQAILHKKSNKEIAALARFYDYFEIQPLGNNEFMVRDGIVANKNELIAINKKIIELGEYWKKPVVATCDVHFMDERDSIYRAILMAGQGFTDADQQAPLYFRTTEQMLAEFSYLSPEKAYEIVVENTNKIADMCEKMKPVPDETCPPVMENSEQEIIDMCNEKARRIYGDPLPEIVQSRMDKELNSIIKHGFSVMYLIAQRLVTKSNSDGYLVGSRGSVGSSFVAFLSDITEVNALPPHYVCKKCKYSEFITDSSVGSGVDMPDKNCPLCGEPLYKDGHDIPFETFLGFDGDKEPDIDLNFSGEYQPNAHKYTEVLFGEGHVFRAGTISTIKDKTAYGFVKGYLNDRNIVTTNAEINRLVAGCAGVKRTTGQHPGGVMILPKGHDIHEFCPIQHAADKEDSSITTHFDYHSISGRLLKLDILGHDDPTMIRMLEDLTGVDAKTIPLDDKETMSLFAGTEALGVTPEEIGSDVGTFGVPELGTRFVRQMLVDTKPTTFSELVRISGLSHGTDVWTNNAQDLVRSGTATLREAICTRDDIMLYLITKGVEKKTAFTIMERVRKGKGLTDDDVKIMEECNVPKWYIDSCNKIKYMFPKAHAVAYITMALRIAWFKVHHPLAYYAAMFSVRADEFDAQIMCDEATARRKKRELEALGNELSAKDKNVLTILELVCEMFSRGFSFTGIDAMEANALRFKEVDGKLMPSLNALPGLGASVAEKIVEEREKESFGSIEDLRIRCGVNQTLIQLMKEMNCFGDMPESDQITFF